MSLEDQALAQAWTADSTSRVAGAGAVRRRQARVRTPAAAAGGRREPGARAGVAAGAAATARRTGAARGAGGAASRLPAGAAAGAAAAVVARGAAAAAECECRGANSSRISASFGCTAVLLASSCRARAVGLARELARTCRRGSRARSRSSGWCGSPSRARRAPCRTGPGRRRAPRGCCTARAAPG